MAAEVVARKHFDARIDQALVMLTLYCLPYWQTA